MHKVLSFRVLLVFVCCAAAVAQFRSNTIYLSGNVVLEGGGVPSELVQIERFCGSRVFPGGFTDAKGKFTVRIAAGDPGAVLPDASNQGTDFRGRGIGDPSASGGLTGRTESMSTLRNAGTVDMYGCDLRARLAGYRSDAIPLGRRSVFDKPEIGTLVLHPYEGIQGALVSATTLEAPAAARKLYARAQKEWRQKKPNYAKARKDLDKAVASYPAYAAAWDLLGKTRLSLQDEQGAREAYAKALEADGMYIRPYVPLIKLTVRSGSWLRAFMLSSNFLRLNPHSLDAKFYAALSAFQLEKYGDAAQSMAALLNEDGAAREFPLVYHLKGLIHTKQGDFEKAASAYREFLETGQESPTVEEVKKQLNEWEALGVIASVSN